jgi:MFS transporter, FHS family, L-fucose permease
MENKKESSQKLLIIPLIIIGIIFFVIGFGVGISGFLTPALRSAFDLSTGQAYLVTAAIFSAFVIFGRPSAIVISRIGYRRSMVAAFMIMAVGMLVFVPSARAVNFPLFLLALFIGGIGNTLLQASVNPYITIMGPIESAAKRMSMMGISNKLAWWVAPLFLGLFIDLRQVRLDDVALPFLLVAGILFILGIAVYFAPLPEVAAKGENETDESAGDSAYARKKTSILQFPHLLIGAVAAFFYIGIEILPMASVIDFAKVTFGDVPNLERFSVYVTLGLVAGYVFGVFTIPKILSQKQALVIFSLLGVFATFLLAFSPVEWAFYCLLLVSFSNSLMWPAIWPLALADLGRFTKTGASFLVMGIFGGAVIPLLFGFLVDLGKNITQTDSVNNYQTAYLIMAPCYAFILYFALHGHKIRR